MNFKLPTLASLAQNTWHLKYLQFVCVYCSQWSYLFRLYWSRKTCTASVFLAPQILRKHAYSNISKISPPKTESFPIKILIFFISAQNIDCWYSLDRLGEAVLTSTQNLCFWAEIWKVLYTPVNPSFTLSKWGLRGSKLYKYVFVMGGWEGILNFTCSQNFNYHAL